MFKWLLTKSQKAIVRSQEGELLLFVQALRGMTQDELAGLLVASTRQRKNLPDYGINLTEFLEGGAPAGHELYALKIGSIIKDMQKSKDLAAAGALMVWLHSVRAISSPPLRIHGKSLWEELMRGFTFVDAAWYGMFSSGLPLDDTRPDDCLYVPRMLDPRIK